MSNKIFGIILFTVGFLCGIRVAGHHMRYRDKASDEGTEEKNDTNSVDEEKLEDLNHKDKYERLVEEHQYQGRGRYPLENKENPTIYLLPFDDFGMKEDYETVSYIYYADGVLTDEKDSIISDISDTVTVDALIFLEDNAEDSDVVYVRNEARKTDYEIVSVAKRYADIDRSGRNNP